MKGHVNSQAIAKRLLSGASLRVLSLSANVIVAFFLTPYLIFSLGDRLYGFWTIVGAFMGFYGFLDLGLSSAIARYVSRSCSQEDHQEVNIIINTSLVLFSFIGLVAMFVTIAVVFFSPSIMSSPEDISLFRFLIIIFGIDISLGFPMRAIIGALIAKLRYDLLAYIDLLKLIIRTALIFYFVNMGYGLVALAFITIVVNVIGYTLTICGFRSNYRDFVLGCRFIEKKQIKQLFDYGKYTFVGQVSDFLRFRIDSFIVAGFLGLEMVTMYSIAQKLIDYFGDFMTSAMGLLTPVFSEYEGRGEFEKIRSLFLCSTKICTAGTIFVGGCILFYGKNFITLWVGADYDVAYSILVILCLALMLGLMQNPSIGLLYGISKHKYYAISNSCEGLLNVALSLVLVRYYGVYGVAMGTLVEMLIFKVFIQPVFTCRSISLPVFVYFNEIAIAFIKLVPAMMVYFYAASFVMTETYFSILTVSFIQVVIFAPYCYMFVIGDRGRRVFRLAFSSG